MSSYPEIGSDVAGGYPGWNQKKQTIYKLLLIGLPLSSCVTAFSGTKKQIFLPPNQNRIAFPAAMISYVYYMMLTPAGGACGVGWVVV